MEFQRNLHPNQLCSGLTSLTGTCWASGQKQLNSKTSLFLPTTRHSYLLTSFHISTHLLCIIPNPVTITHFDCTLHYMNGSLCYTVYLEQFVFTIVCVQVMGRLPSNCFRVAVEQVSWKEGHWWWWEEYLVSLYFFSISSFVYCFGERMAVSACRPVHHDYVCACVRACVWAREM